MTSKFVKRLFFLGIAIAFISLGVLQARAQGDAPAALVPALADVGKRVGKTLTLADFNNATSKWSWNFVLFTDTSLQCPASGKAATPAQILGYQIVFVYLGTVYDYRVEQTDSSTLFLCPGSTGASVVSGGTTAASAVTGVAASVGTRVPVPTDLRAEGVCPDNLPIRLHVGGIGHVLPGLPNNIRDDGAYTAMLLGEIPAGGFFSVIGGPKCDRGFRYWQINYHGLVGWTAEGLNSTYFVE